MRMSVITAGVLLGLGTAVALPAGAVTISASNTTAQINEAAHTVTVTIETEGTTVDGFLFDLVYDSTLVSLPPYPGPGLPSHVTVVGTGAGDLICNDFGPAPISVFRCIATTPITSPTLEVQIAFAVGATDAPAPGMPLTFGADTVYVTDGGLSEPPFETVNAGSVTILTGPPADVEVTFVPANGGTVSFSSGAPTASIAVENTGTIGTGLVDNCVITGPDAAAFSITAGDPTTVPPAGQIDLAATFAVPAVALDATLTCDVADASTTTTASWSLVGTPLAGPTLGFNPNGGALTLPSGPAGNATANIGVTVTAPGDTGGPSSTASCSVLSGPFTVSGSPVTVAAGSSTGGDIGVSCTRSDTGPDNGQVECSIDGGAPVSFEVECPQASAAPPPPTFIPATSLWSKFALIGVFAALGLLMVGLRRNH